MGECTSDSKANTCPTLCTNRGRSCQVFWQAPSHPDIAERVQVSTNCNARALKHEDVQIIYFCLIENSTVAGPNVERRGTKALDVGPAV